MQQILQLIQGYSFEEHLLLIVDEVSVVENLILKRFLSEARKYNLSLILSQQYFSQVSEDLRKSIFANVINYYIFRVARSDAQILESNLQMEVAVRNSFIVRIKILTELNNRECILRVSNNGRILSAFKARTLDFKSIPRHKEKRTFSKNINTSKDNNIDKSFNFSIDSHISLKKLMASQSSSRKKVFNDESKTSYANS
jgi:hypothetical protein